MVPYATACFLHWPRPTGDKRWTAHRRQGPLGCPWVLLVGCQALETAKGNPDVGRGELTPGPKFQFLSLKWKHYLCLSRREDRRSEGDGGERVALFIALTLKEY